MSTAVCSVSTFGLVNTHFRVFTNSNLKCLSALFQVWLSGIKLVFKHLKLIQIIKHFQFRVSSVRGGEKSKFSLTLGLVFFIYLFHFYFSLGFGISEITSIWYLWKGNRKYIFLKHWFQNSLIVSTTKFSSMVISHLQLLTTKIIGKYNMCCILNTTSFQTPPLLQEQSWILC